jgi:hypothetical protein
MGPFQTLASKLSKEPGVTDPKALAATIGRKKFGAKRFDKAAAKGVDVKSVKP